MLLPESANLSNRYFIEQILTTLQTVESESLYADKLIETCLRNHTEWSEKERGEYVTSVYDMLSLKRMLCAAVNNSSLWQQYAAYLLLTERSVPKLPEVEGVTLELIKQNLANASEAQRLSYPDWLHAIATQELGEQWPLIAEAMNQRASTFIRCNTLKTDVKTLQAALLTQGIESEWLGEQTLKLNSVANLFKSTAFQQGWFEMQDVGSQQIAPLLEVGPSMRVVDACSGAGGKSLHLAALMQNKGYVLAMDIHEQKLTTLKKRAKRAGAHMIETRVITSTKTVKRLQEKFDRVLLDVPCSGTGVFKRNPDAKWHLTEQNLQELVQLQSEILNRYSKMCKPGAILVYATCSILPRENQQQIAQFLSQNSQFELVSEHTLLPGINSDGDGFYAAKLRLKKSA